MEKDLDAAIVKTHKAELDAVNRAITAMANRPGDANVNRLRKAIAGLANATAGMAGVAHAATKGAKSAAQLSNALDNKPGKPQKVDAGTAEVCAELQRDKMLAEDKIDVYETTMGKIVLVDKVPKKIKAHIKSMRAALAELTAEDTAEGTGEYDDGNGADLDTSEGMSKENDDNDD